MPTVSGKLTNPIAALPTNPTVTITLVDGAGAPVLGFVQTPDREMVSNVVVIPAGSTAWSAVLPAQTDIQPTNTYYQIIESGGSGTFTYYIQVPNGAGPYWAGDIRQTLPDIPASSASQTNLTLLSSFDGGENDYDSTSHITVQSYQRAQQANEDDTDLNAHYGEGLRLDLMRNNAKNMIAWREGYIEPESASDPRSIAWIGADGAANDADSWHNHISIEVPDTTGALQTRLEIPFAAWDEEDGYGIADGDAMVRVTNAKFIATGSPAMIVEGAAGAQRQIDFATSPGRVSSGAPANRRWSIQTDGTAEGGSNAGSDYRILRRDDSGDIIETAVFVKRSTGQVGVGNITSPAAKLDVTAAGSYHTGQFTQTTGSTVVYAALSLNVAVVGNKVLDGRLTGDASGRIAAYGDGKLEWGDGGAGGRDTNLYRSAANVLKTDDKLITTIGLGVGNSAAATTSVGSLARKIEVFDASGASLGFIPVYSTIT